MPRKDMYYRLERWGVDTPVEMLGDDAQTDFPRSQFPPGGVGVLPSTSVTLMSDGSRRLGCAGNGQSPGEVSMTDLGFPQVGLVQDIPDVMGLWALRPSAAIVKVMSVPDSRCIRVVTTDDHVNIGFHEYGR